MIRHLIERILHPRRRYFVSVDPASNIVVRGYTDGRVVHLTSMGRNRP